MVFLKISQNSLENTSVRFSFLIKLQASGLCIDAQKGASYYRQNIMLQFYTCYHKNNYAARILLEKLCHMKSNINFRDQAWKRLPTKCWVKDFILLHKYHGQNSYQRFWQP